MKIAAIVLVALGILALIYGGFDYNRSRTILQMGSMSVTATEHRSVPVPAVVGVVMLIGGVALLLVGRRRSSS